MDRLRIDWKSLTAVAPSAAATGEDKAPETASTMRAERPLMVYVVSSDGNDSATRKLEDVVFANEQVAVGAKFFDVCYMTKSPGTNPVAQESKFLLDLCTFDHNWRDLVAIEEGKNMPLAPGDKTLHAKEFISFDPGHKDFLRPKKTSPLATEGAGKEDLTLPAYVGAIPPEDVEAWDWNKTWKAKFGRQ